MKDTERKLYKDVLESWGIAAQMDMAIEECSELINALCKLRRGRVGPGEVITEVADVMIMCEQLACYFGEVNVDAEKDYKFKRLQERLAKWKEKRKLLKAEL